MGEADRESLLNGLHAVVQEGRRNINGSRADIAVTSIQTWRRIASQICLASAGSISRLPKTNSRTLLLLLNIILALLSK